MFAYCAPLWEEWVTSVCDSESESSAGSASVLGFLLLGLTFLSCSFGRSFKRQAPQGPLKSFAFLNMNLMKIPLVVQNISKRNRSNYCTKLTSLTGFSLSQVSAYSCFIRIRISSPRSLWPPTTLASQIWDHPKNVMFCRKSKYQNVDTQLNTPIDYAS